MKDLVIIGACGETFEIIDALSAINEGRPVWRISGIVDDDKRNWERPFYKDISVIGDFDMIADLDMSRSEFIITSSSVGTFLKKCEIVDHLGAKYPGISFATLMHPRAQVSDSAQIGHGTYIAAGVVVDANAWIGNHCIVHFYSVISRFVEIGDCTFISSGVVITGNRKIGRSVYLGVKSTVNGNVGDNVLVSGGTIVKKDVTANSIVSNNIGLDVINFEDKEEMQTILSELPEP